MRRLTAYLLALLLVLTSNNVFAGNTPLTPLCGYYSIGASQPAGFQNLTQALAQLNSNGINCTVVFELEADYNSATETFPLVINTITGADEFNTFTIKPAFGVTSIAITGNSATAILKINGADYVTIDGSNDGDFIQNLTITNTNAALNTAVVWVGSGGAGNGATYNLIKNCIISGATNITTTYGLFTGSGTTLGTLAAAANGNNTLYNNIFRKCQNGVYVIGANSLDPGWMIQGNTFGSTSVATDKLSYRGIFISNALNFSVYENTINGVVSTASSNSIMTGIQVGVVISGGSIYKNRISDIKQINTAGWGANGIYLSSSSSAANVNVYNNLIYDITGHGFNAATATDNGYGIMVGAGGGYNIYYNSINMATSQTNVNSVTAAINIGVSVPSSSVKLIDNILVNTETVGTRYAIYCAASNTVFNSINYNDYYSSQHVGYLSGIRMTLADWKGITAQDLNSISVDPGYRSANNLQIFSPLSPVLGAGTPIPTVPLDYVDFTRSLTNTSIGAYEQSADLTGPTISFTPFNNNLCTGNRTLSDVIIDDDNGVETNPGLRPRLYFKKSTNANTYVNNTSATNGWKYVEATGTGGSPFSFTTDFSLINGGVAIGNVIEYFIVAQDLEPIPNVGIANGIFNIFPDNVALLSSAFPLTGTILSYTILSGGLNSNVTIGTGGTYTSLTKAGGLFAAINASGLTNNITATIISANVAEDGAVALNPISYGCVGSYKLTIKPNSGLTPTLSGNNSTALIKISGADNVMINGSNSGSTSRDLTITNTFPGNASVVWFASTATDGARDDTLRNCNIVGMGTSTSSTTADVMISGSVMGGEAEKPNQRISIFNNSLTAAICGITTIGNTDFPDNGFELSNNTVNNIGCKGISVHNADDVIISANQITGVATSSLNISSAIVLSGTSTNIGVTENIIRNVRNDNPAGFGSNGIYLNSESEAANITVVNNMISDIASYGYPNSTATDNGYGIYIEQGAGYTLHYNTVYLNTEQVSSAGITAAIIIGAGVNAPGAIDMQNNIFASIQTVGAERYSIYCGADNTVFSNMNYNDYACNGPNLAYLSVNIPDLATLKTAFGGNGFSVSAQPVFVSSTDMHLKSANTSNFLNLESKGVDVVVSTDIDLENRPNGTAPDIGADEFEGVANPLNDDANAAILLTVGGGCSGSPYTNYGGSQSTGEPFAACIGTAGYKTVWYKFVAPASGAVMVSTDYSGGTMGTDSRVSLFSATDENNYATFTNVACDDDNGNIVTDKSILYAVGLTAGNTYYIQVDGKDATTVWGTFCLSVDELNSGMLSTTTACGAGQSLTGVNNNYTGWISLTGSTGKLIALLNNPSGPATTSTYTGGININAAATRLDATSFQYYLNRNYFINNTAVSNIDIRFFFLNTELSSLQASDNVVALANLQVTRQTGTICRTNFLNTNGTNSSLLQTNNGNGTGYSWIQVSSPALSNFYLHTKKSSIPVKVFLQGAYLAGGGRHKNISTAWTTVMNANALNQPYSQAPFIYAGTESVSPAFFTTASATTDIVDWVLVDLRDFASPSTVVVTRAAFLRVDGRIVDLNGTFDLGFRNLTNGNYYVSIRHRNHLGIRSSGTIITNGTMGFSQTLYNFTSSQAQAYQNGTVTSNPAMKDLGGGVFGMYAGNGNNNTTVRANGGANPSINDYQYLITTLLSGSTTIIIPNVYSTGDFNLDGSVRANGGASSAVNDYQMLVNGALSGSTVIIIAQHL